MHYCVPIEPIPCIQYVGTNQAEVDQFLIKHGGHPARFDEKGRAEIATTVKAEIRIIYCTPGHWLRVLAHAQFTAVSNRLFNENYRLVPAPTATAAVEPLTPTPANGDTTNR